MVVRGQLVTDTPSPSRSITVRTAAKSASRTARNGRARRSTTAKVSPFSSLPTRSISMRPERERSNAWTMNP